MNVTFFLKEQQHKFTQEFQLLSDEALILCFNKQVCCLGGNNIRAVYLRALRNEILQRNFDSSLVMNKCGFNLKCKVQLEDKRLVQQP